MKKCISWMVFVLGLSTGSAYADGAQTVETLFSFATLSVPCFLSWDASVFSSATTRAKKDQIAMAQEDAKAFVLGGEMTVLLQDAIQTARDIAAEEKEAVISEMSDAEIATLISRI